MGFSIHTPVGTGRYCHPVTAYNSYVTAPRVYGSSYYNPCRPCFPKPYYPSTYSTYYPSYTSSYSSYNPCHYRATPVYPQVYPHGCHQTAAKKVVLGALAVSAICALL